MSNYTQVTYFTPKDSLPTGNAAKVVRGSEHDTEFAAIATAIATKYDSVSNGLTATGLDLSCTTADLGAISALATNDRIWVGDVSDGGTMVAEYTTPDAIVTVSFATVGALLADNLEGVKWNSGTNNLAIDFSPVATGARDASDYVIVADASNGDLPLGVAMNTLCDPPASTFATVTAATDDEVLILDTSATGASKVTTVSSVGSALTSDQTFVEAIVANADFKAAMVDVFLPVGSTLILNTADNPNTTYPGTTWVEDVKGRVIVGVGTSNADDNGETVVVTLGQEGGEYNHTLTDGEMPSHNHNIQGSVVDQYGGASGKYDVGTGSGTKSGTAGSDDPHNNVQPYKGKHIWTRTV